MIRREATLNKWCSFDKRVRLSFEFLAKSLLCRRRKNLAVHLGLDDTVSKREVQKINTYRDLA